MRRMMHAFFLFAAGSVSLSSAASAQLVISAQGSDSTGVVSNSPAQPMFATQQMIPCGNSQGNADSHSPLAILMDADPCHPNLWSSYPAERAARLNHLYHHLNGCDCLDPKRGLHSHPSTICGDASCSVANGRDGAFGNSTGCDTAASRINRYRTHHHGFSQKGSFSSLYSEPTGACASGLNPVGVHKLFKPAANCDTAAPTAPAAIPTVNSTQAPTPSNRLAAPGQTIAAPSLTPIASSINSRFAR